MPISKSKSFIEPRAASGFSAKLEGGKRAVVIGDTQLEVIREGKSKYPGVTIHVARVRAVGPGPDHFREV